MTTTKTHSPLAELLDVHAGPCISIYLPTPRGFAEKPHNHTRFHNLLRTAQSGLPDTLSVAARDAMRHHLVQSRRRFTETVLAERVEGAALQES